MNDLKLRLEQSYSLPVKKNIRLLTFNPDTVPVGSFVFKIQRYPGDIDMRELIKGCCDVGEVIEDVENKLRKKMIEIYEDPDAFFAEFKAGIDPMFDIDIGYLDYSKNVVQGYCGLKLGQWMEKLTKMGIIAYEEFKDMIPFFEMRFIKPDDWLMLKNFIREKKTLRWSMDEIMRGEKMMSGNRIKKLTDAMKEPSIVKLDIWAWINDRFVELSNFMILILETPEGDFLINGEQPDYFESIREDIQKYFSPYEFNPFKAMKRMWLLARVYEDQGTIRKINPLLTSGYAITKQVIDDIESILGIIETVEKIPIDRIRKEIDEFKSRLSYVYEMDLDMETLDGLLDEASKEDNVAEMVNILEYIESYIKKELNIAMFEYAKKMTLYPPKEYYLPMNGGTDTKKIIKGEGFTAHYLRAGEMGGVDFLWPLKKSYQTLANVYRSKKCKGQRKLKVGEIHPLCANFEGPGTRIDLPEVRNAKPYNNVDACAKVHDLEYNQAGKQKDKNKKARMIKEADEKFIKCIEPFKNEEPYYSLGKAGIEGKMKASKVIPFLMRRLAPDYHGEGCDTCKGGSEVQSIIFKKKQWSVPKAEKWLKKHKYKVIKVDETEDYYRFRQRNPDYRKKFRTIDFGKNDGIKAIIEFDRNK